MFLAQFGELIISARKFTVPGESVRQSEPIIMERL